MPRSTRIPEVAYTPENRAIVVLAYAHSMMEDLLSDYALSGQPIPESLESVTGFDDLGIRFEETFLQGNAPKWSCNPQNKETLDIVADAQRHVDKWLREISAQRENVDIRQRFESFGFVFEGTGGGCTALIRRDGDTEELITVYDEAEAPTRLTDRVAVGYWEAGDFKTGTGSDGEYTLADCLAALENPSEEYHLLELRLYNGFHKTAR